MPSIYLFYIFLLALLTVLVLVPPISRLAVSIGIFDEQDERKQHNGAIPRLGGIAIFFAVLLATILFSDIDQHTRGFLAGGVVIFLVGLTDDLSGLSARKKLFGQFVAALIVTVAGGLHLTTLGDLFGTGPVELGYLSIPFTIFALVGVINAVNLMDGLDGLAGGVTAIAAAAMGLIAFNTGNQQLLGLCAALLGAVIGFLKFNNYPAKIFMGDGGSLFLGYSLGTFAVHLVTQGGGQVSAMLPVIILAVPICDTCFVMVKRRLKGRSISAPDRTHIHHRLMEIGIGHKATVVLVYALSYLLAIYAVMFQQLPEHHHLLHLALFVIAFVVLARILEMQVQRHASSFLEDDKSFLHFFTYRWMVTYSRKLLVVVKYLVLLILSLTFFISSRPSLEVASVAVLLILLTVTLIFITNDWSNRFLQFVLYFNGAFLLYIVENYGRKSVIAGEELPMISLFLFSALFLLSGAVVVLRKKSRLLMSSPLEYFILFIVIAIPLLPASFTAPQHLLTVTGKALILSLSYKMIFMLETRRNRKVIVATLLALVACGVRALV